MYNTTFLCTYKLHDDEDDQDTLYRHEYLYAFGLKEYDSDKIISTLDNIYQKLRDNKDFIEIVESHYHFSRENKNHESVVKPGYVGMHSAAHVKKAVTYETQQVQKQYYYSYTHWPS